MGFFQSIDGVLLGAGDVFEEADDLRGFQFARMALLMKEDKPLRPLGIPFAWFWAPRWLRRHCAAGRAIAAPVPAELMAVLTSLNSWNRGAYMHVQSILICSKESRG